jgi:hypothetical protein
MLHYFCTKVVPVVSALVVVVSALQLWDASSCQQCGVLGHHPSFITSLAASGDLSASTCSSELRVWKLSSRQCLFLVPVGLPIPSPGKAASMSLLFQHLLHC